MMVLWWMSDIYAATARILFYLLCRIISEYFLCMKKEIELMATNEINNLLVSDRL